MGLQLEAKVQAFSRETELLYRIVSSSQPLEHNPQNTARNTSFGKSSFLLSPCCPSFVHQLSPFSGAEKPMFSSFLWLRECKHLFSHLGGQCLPPPQHVEGDNEPVSTLLLTTAPVWRRAFKLYGAGESRSSTGEHLCARIAWVPLGEAKRVFSSWSLFQNFILFLFKTNT